MLRRHLAKITYEGGPQTPGQARRLRVLSAAGLWLTQPGTLGGAWGQAVLEDACTGPPAEPESRAGRSLPGGLGGPLLILGTLVS